MPVGVLALQGDFEAHGRALEQLGVVWVEVRTEAEVRSADGLVLPGGESTTVWRLMEGNGIAAAICALAARGCPILATCAGAILISREVLAPDRPGLALLDVASLRNAYGRQLDSAVVKLTDLDRAVLGEVPLEAVFIRAPRFTRLGPEVEVLARRNGDPVLLRQGRILAAAFHPELSADRRVHALFLEGGPGTRRVANG